jgi:acetone carboxylase alpha subunit
MDDRSEGYEDNPGIRPGDIFANNDAFIGTVQVPDVMDVVPIFHRWTNWSAGRVRSATSWKRAASRRAAMSALAQERFTEGLFVCAEKIGENDEIRRDYVIRCERNLRMPIYWVLDEKAKVASCIDMREACKASSPKSASTTGCG